MCRRLISGLGQLLLALAGCVLIFIWMVEMIYSTTMRQIGEGAASHEPPGWMWKYGLILFAAGWLWSLITSIAMWREAKSMTPPSAVPPIVTNPPEIK